ncbi:MAG: ion channel [Acidobacteriota bacterium]
MAEETLDNNFTALSTESEEDRDLGFGSVVAGRSQQRLLNPDGTFNVQRAGVGFLTSLNLYHTVLTLKWRVFLSLVLLLYFLSNIFFGLLYSSLGAEAIVDTSSSPTENVFIRAFFFSVQTFATIGYGTIHPVGIVPNLLVTIESYYSLLANALITGVVFARFARPVAKVVFSEVSVIAPYRGRTGFMFRIVNGRSNQLIEVEAKVMFARFVNENGVAKRRFDLLELERRKVAFFPLAWTVVHPIDESSPMYGLTADDLKRTDAEILILLSATDETFAQVVHTRSSYKHDEILIGQRFADLYRKTSDGEALSINIKKLSATEPAEK